MKKVIVRINKGKVTVEAQGYKGESCKDATKPIERALGMTVDDTPTSEMYEQQEESTYLDENV